MRIERLEELRVWNISIDFAKTVYQLTKKNQDYGYRDQLRRAVVSISNNIAEGFGRQSKKEFSRFLFYARGSCFEVKSMIHLGKQLGYFEDSRVPEILLEQERINKMIWGLISYLSKK